MNPEAYAKVLAAALEYNRTDPDMQLPESEEVLIVMQSLHAETWRRRCEWRGLACDCGFQDREDVLDFLIARARAERKPLFYFDEDKQSKAKAKARRSVRAMARAALSDVIEPVCKRCGDAYARRDGHDPTPFCDRCAQALIEIFAAWILSK